MSSLKSDYFFIDSLKKVKQKDWNACVDDDHPFRERLSRSMQKKGFEVDSADSFASALEIIEKQNLKV